MPQTLYHQLYHHPSQTRHGQAIALNYSSNLKTSNLINLTEQIFLHFLIFCLIIHHLEFIQNFYTTITASKNTYTDSTKSKSWSESLTLASTVGNPISQALEVAINALALSISKSKSSSDTSITNYNNSNLTAQNGNIKITSNGTNQSGTQSGGDTNIKGANLLAKNTEINSNGNLNIESLQNQYNSKSKSSSFNLGGGINKTGSIGFSQSRSGISRSWVDNQTSIIGTDSVIINTGNNTNLKGSVIANVKTDNTDGGNLSLTTKTLTTSDIQDKQENKFTGYGISTNIGIGSSTSDPSTTNPNQQNNYFPNGSTTLTASNQGNIKEQITRATIGNGIINITDNTSPINNTDLDTLNRDITKSQEITKDTITAALNVSATIDNRLFDITGEGQKQMAMEVVHLAPNLITTAALAGGTAKDLLTSFTDINQNDPKNKNYADALYNNLKLRADSVNNPAILLSQDKKARYYNDPNHINDQGEKISGYYNPETGETFINLANNQNPEDLLNTILHETYHQTTNLPKGQEEQLAQNYAGKASGLINFYNNNDNAFLRDMFAASDASSGFSVNNWSDNIKNNLSQNQVDFNNKLAHNTNPQNIETYLLPDEKMKLVNELKGCNGNKSCEQKVQNKYEAVSGPRDEEFFKEVMSCAARKNCEAFYKTHYDLRSKLTSEGNEYYKLHPEEFQALPKKSSIFHSYQEEQFTGKAINIISGRTSGITKYVHPIYGYEIVLDLNKNIVTNPLNGGTYNFYNPELGGKNPLLESGFSHFRYDMEPYYMYGNAPYPKDPTTPTQRYQRNLNYLYDFKK